MLDSIIKEMTKRKSTVKKGVCESRLVNTKAVERARSLISAPADLSVAADAMKVLGHPARLSILEALESQELCVCDLSVVLGLSMPATSQHLRELRRLGAIQYRSLGKFAYYQVTEPFWLELARTVMTRLGTCYAKKRKMKRVV